MDESKPLQSKKFVAYLVAESTWKLALLLVIGMGMKNGTIDVIVGSIVLAIVIIAGFIEAGYILGQASLDKYIRVAQIASENGRTLSLKGMEMGHAQATPTATPAPEPATTTDPPAVG
jgi:hypothetical protein